MILLLLLGHNEERSIGSGAGVVEARALSRCWLVRPVQVVQHYHQGLPLGGSLQKSRNKVKQAEPGLLRTIQVHQED